MREDQIEEQELTLTTANVCSFAPHLVREHERRGGTDL